MNPKPKVQCRGEEHVPPSVRRARVGFAVWLMKRVETTSEAASLAEACSASFSAAGIRPGLLLWRIDQKVLVSASTPGSFYEDAAYIVLLTTQAGPDALS